MGIKVTLHKLATKSFALVGFVNRGRLLMDIRLIHEGLPSNLRAIFDGVLRDHGIIQPSHLHLDLPELRQEHLAKTLTMKNLKALVAAFAKGSEEAEKQERHSLKIEGKRVVLVPPQLSLAGLQPPLSLQKIDLSGIRTILVTTERPLTFNELLESSQGAYPYTQKRELKAHLRKLREGEKVLLTMDGEYFWAEEKEGAGTDFLLEKGLLFQLFTTKDGANVYVSRNSLNKRLKDGKIVEIFRSSDSVYVLRRTLEELEQNGRIARVFGAKNRTYHFFSEELEGAVQNGRIVYGAREGVRIHIFANKSSIRYFGQEIYGYEIEQIIKTMKEKGKLKEGQTDAFRRKLLEVFRIWQEAEVEGSVFQNIYLAQKVAQATGDEVSVLTALLSIVPFAFLQKSSLAAILTPSQREEVLENIHHLKIARSIPFFIPEDDHHYIQNFMWYLIIFMKDLKSMGLLLYEKLKTLVMEPEKISPEEIRFLYARLAERFEFADLPDNLGNLIFKAENPAKHEEYRAKIEEATGMSLQAAKRYLSRFAQELKGQLVELGIPRKAIHIYYHRKTEASTYEKVEVREHERFEKLWDLLQIRVVIDSQQGVDEAEAENLNLRHLLKAAEYLTREYLLKHTLPTDYIDDYINNPKKSGWQGLALRALGPQEKRVEILLMTKRMHDNERFLRVRQLHFNYAIQRVLKEQKFDDYPYELIERLTGDPEHDYPLIRNYLLTHWVWVFLVSPKDPRTRLSEHVWKNLANLISEGRIELQMKRLPLGSTPIDLAAGVITQNYQGERDNLISSYDGTEIYRFALDEKSEEGMAMAFDGKQGIPPNWGVGYHLQNGDIVFLRQSDSPFGGKILGELSSAPSHCQRPAAKISLRKLFRDRVLPEETGRGKSEVSRRFPGISEDAIQRIATQYKFSSTDDLFAAIGSGIIPLAEIEEVYKQLVITIESRGTEQFMRIRMPDRKGAIKLLFNLLLKNRALLHLYSSSPYYLFGERRCEIILKIHPLNINVETLTQHILRLLESQSGREFPVQTFPLTIRIKSTGGNWNHIQKLMAELERERINLLHINLPKIQPGEIKEGTLEVEIPVDTFSDVSMLDIFMEELEGMPGVVEIKYSA